MDYYLNSGYGDLLSIIINDKITKKKRLHYSLKHNAFAILQSIYDNGRSPIYERKNNSYEDYPGE
jgi:hypothetical protein